MAGTKRTAKSALHLVQAVIKGFPFFPFSNGNSCLKLHSGQCADTETWTTGFTLILLGLLGEDADLADGDVADATGAGTTGEADDDG